MPSAGPIDETSICFDGFTLDIQRRGLYRGSERIHLTPTPFKVLEFLIRHRGAMVSKELLLDAVWGGQREENTVEQAIRQIRRALGEEKEQPRFIQTIPGVGYCFIAEVEDEEPEEPETGFSSAPLSNNLSGEVWYSTLIRRATWPLVLAVYILILVMIFLMHSPLRLTAENPVRITRSQNSVLSPLLSDGAQIYSPQYEGGRYSIVATPVRGGDSVTVPEEIANPEICDLAPDGSALLLRNLIRSRNDDEPLYVQAEGGAVQRLGNILAYDAAWFPHMQRILYSADGVVYSTDLAGKVQQPLFSVPGNAYWFRWSPDGRKLRFTVIDKANEATSIWEVAVGIYKPHRLFPKISNHLCCGTWTPNGRFFLFQARVENTFQIWSQQETHSFLYPFYSNPFPLVTGASNYRGPLVSKDGKRLFLRAEEPKGELEQYDAQSKAFVPVLPAMSVRTASFSRDGRWIAYTTLADGNLWRCRTEGTDCLQLTQDFRNTLMPRWSPDGQSITFMGLGFKGDWGIFVVQKNGGSIRALIRENQAEGYPDWSSDGQRLVFSEVIPVARPEGVHILNLRTNQVSTLPESTSFYFPRWSPDGRLIVALHAGDHHLYLYDLATKQWRPLTDLPAGYPNWSADSKAVYFLSNSGGRRTVYRAAIATRMIDKITSVESVDPSPSILGDWMGLTADDAPVVVQDMSTDDIYAWDLASR